MNLMKRAICCIVAVLPGWGMAQAAMAEETPAAPVAAATEAAPAPAPAEQVFARVNGKPILAQEFKARYNAIIRQRFYHGAPPESQAEAVRQEVADLLIERALLIEEAERRGIQPDMVRVEQAAASADKRYAEEPGWERQREVFLPRLKEQVARQSLYEQVEKAVRDVPPPAPADVRAFYDQKAELFTEPEKLYMSIIVLSVDPSSPREEWAKAREEMQKIVQRIKDGADFAEMARQYSKDKSASNGGNMGYVHSGMLAEHLQAKMDSFKPGEMTDPVTILEGVAIYRLDDRVPSKLMEFAEVEQRALDLLQRERVEQAWKETISRLRAAANIEILLPIGSGGAAAQGEGAAQGGSAKQDAAPAQESKKEDAPAPDAKQPDSVTPEPGAAQKAVSKKKTGSKKKASKKP
ncbi:MAG: peptidylprolyl isomerase [Nitrosomonadales bacterium]|nr:peptidylprolyl isomerase [Nitrosomonadales bacterium]